MYPMVDHGSASDPSMSTRWSGIQTESYPSFSALTARAAHFVAASNGGSPPTSRPNLVGTILQRGSTLFHLTIPRQDSYCGDTGRFPGVLEILARVGGVCGIGSEPPQRSRRKEKARYAAESTIARFLREDSGVIWV